MSDGSPKSMVLAVMLVALPLGLARAQEPPRPDAPPQWQRFVSDEGGFSISMPGRPTVSSESIRAKTTGHPIRKSQYIAELGPRTYMVMTGDFDARDDIVMDGVVQGIAADRTLIGRKLTAVQGRRAEIVDVADAKFRFRFLLLPIGKRLYEVVFGTTRDDFSSREADAFLDSFRLLR